MIRGYLFEGNLLGATNFMVGTKRNPDGPEFTEAEWKRKDALAKLVIEGLCRKYAARECGKPEPYDPKDV